ncbi:MAG: GNAT family N-acetyltransferase [Nostoc indistinguendum CM1-VF10]|jgi:RimJ/RimL family protein N-acetyltransferase|nr:GNAT family N-acetyltransferase [Nostoc indistinguendum CM1-VF10]
MQYQNWQSPQYTQLNGQFVTLKPLVPERDVDALYLESHGTPSKEGVWNYMFYGPFDSRSAMQDWMETDMIRKSDPLTWTVFENSTNSQVGIVALLAIVPNHGRAEIGHVWFSPAVHKTKVNTESQFLLLQHLFDHLYTVELSGNAMHLTMPAELQPREWDSAMKGVSDSIWSFAAEIGILIGLQ